MTADTPDAPDRGGDLSDPLAKLREQMRELTDQLDALSTGTPEDEDQRADGGADVEGNGDGASAVTSAEEEPAPNPADEATADVTEAPAGDAPAELESAEPTGGTREEVEAAAPSNGDLGSHEDAADAPEDGIAAPEAAPQDAAETAPATKPDLQAKLAALEAAEAELEAGDDTAPEPEASTPDADQPDTSVIGASPDVESAADTQRTSPHDTAAMARDAKPDLEAKLAALEAAEAKLEAGDDTAPDAEAAKPDADQPDTSAIEASQDDPESDSAAPQPEDAGPQDEQPREADARKTDDGVPAAKPDDPATPAVVASDVDAGDPRQRTVAGRQVIVDDDTLDQTGVRLEELPTPVAKKRRAPRVLAVVAVLALIAVGLFAVGWWIDQRDTETTDETAEAAATVEPEATQPPAASDSDAGAVPTTAPAEAAVPADEPAPTESTLAAEAPAEPTAEVDPDVVVEAASTALADAGYSTISARYDDGTLVVEGVLPSSDLTSGYFSEIDNVTSTVADVPGVDVVASRLFLRGDDERLRKQLAAISRQQPIEFNLGSAELTNVAKAALTDASVVILANPGLRVLVAGHTDASGSAETNAELATARTGAVILELVALGVPITRLQPVTYGELFLDEDATDAANRRVAFEVAP